jgi:hypothetical protein
VFINAYLLGTTVFARQGTLSGSKLARYAAEIMATEAVHRAVALQSLGKLGNDRVYAKFAQREVRPRRQHHHHLVVAPARRPASRAGRRTRQARHPHDNPAGQRGTAA